MTISPRLSSGLFRRMNLTVLLAVGFGVLTLLLTLQLMMSITKTASRQIERDVGQDLMRTATHMHELLDRGMLERYREIRTFAALDTQVWRSGGETARNWLDTLQRAYPYYAWIGYADAAGRVVAASGGILQGTNVGDRPWFVHGRRGPYIGDAHDTKWGGYAASLNDGELARFVDIAMPIYDQNKRLIGVLAAHLSWQWALEVERTIVEPFGESGAVETVVVDTNGEVLLGPSAMRGLRPRLESLRAATNGNSGYRQERWSDGREYVTGYSHSRVRADFPGLGWVVLVRQTQDTAYAPVQELQDEVLLSSLAIGVLFILFGVAAARRIGMPLARLTRTAASYRAIGRAGEFEAQGYREVVSLARSLTAMTGELARKEASLEELNKSLEQRVVERTRELSDSQQRLEMIFQSAQEGVLILDADGAVENANRAACIIFRVPAGGLAGKDFRALLPEASRASYDNYMSRVNAGDTGGAGFEAELTQPGGEELPVEMSFGVVRLDVGLRYVGIVRDISERKAVDRMKSEFVATVSHELRTPLTAAIGALYLLQEMAMDKLGDDEKELLQMATANGERLGELINQILDFEKIEAGHVDLRVEDLELLPLLREAIELNQPYAGRFDVRLELGECDPALGVRADAKRLLQVMTNLLSNAAKFSATGSIVTVWAVAQGGGVRVRVDDCGPGIPDDFRDRVFQRFSQVDGSSTRRVGGTGLGLSISKALMEQMHGAIGYEPRATGGTSFYIDLPRAGSGGSSALT